MCEANCRNFKFARGNTSLKEGAEGGKTKPSRLVHMGLAYIIVSSGFSLGSSLVEGHGSSYHYH